MREDADHLIGRLCLEERARVNEDIAAVDDKGVKVLVLHDAHFDAARSQPRRLKNRAGIIAKELFDLSVAYER